MKSQAPAFQTYANELLALTMGLSLEAVGAVHRLFLVMWGQSVDQYTMVDDDQMIARTVGTSLEEWKAIRLEIQHPGRHIFEEKNDRLISPYLKREALKQRKYRELQAEKSKKGVEARVTRGLSAGGARVTSLSSLSSPSSSSNSTSSSNERKKSAVPPAVDLEFEQWWTQYPSRSGRKVEKAEALRKWQCLKAEDRKQVLVAVQHYANSGMVLKGFGIKDPHRWLRNGKDGEPWRDWLTPEQPTNSQEVKNGKLQFPRVGFEERDYRQGIF